MALLVLGAAAATAAAPPKIKPTGVGQVKLGMTFKQLRQKHLVGKLHKGTCDAAGPNASPFARLRSPLRGQANFTKSVPHKLTDITIRGGATARGVGIGDTIPQIKAAYPKAKVDHSTDETFEFTLVRIPKAGGGNRLQFAVSTKTHKIIEIGVPFVAVCE